MRASSFLCAAEVLADRFRVISRLGWGTYAEIYKAYDEKHGDRLVAVKCAAGHVQLAV